MAGDWFAEVHKLGSDEADSVEYFDDYAGLLQHVKNAAVGIKLRIHAPAHATDKERDELEKYGDLPFRY